MSPRTRRLVLFLAAAGLALAWAFRSTRVPPPPPAASPSVPRDVDAFGKEKSY